MRSLHRVVYTAEPGVLGTLTSDGCGLVDIDTAGAGKLTCFMGGGAEYLPRTFTYTAPSGLVMRVSAAGDLESIVDARGAGATFGWSGIAGSAGAAAELAIQLARDAEGRIVRVSGAGAGGTFEYVYDPAGDLVAVTAADGSSVDYGYDADHRLLTVTRHEAGTQPLMSVDRGARPSPVPAALRRTSNACDLQSSLACASPLMSVAR